MERSGSTGRGNDGLRGGFGALRTIRGELASSRPSVAKTLWHRMLSRTDRRDKAKDVDLAPLRGAIIGWTGNRGSWNAPQALAQFVLPGSALRGPLAHRALYRWNQQAGNCVEVPVTSAPRDAASTGLDQFLKNREQLKTLFGEAREGEAEASGLASALYFDSVLTVDHVKIDRFTGGYFPRALYSEELGITEILNCTIHVKPVAGAIEPAARAAFIAALHDLANGADCAGHEKLWLLRRLSPLSRRRGCRHAGPCAVCRMGGR